MCARIYIRKALLERPINRKCTKGLRNEEEDDAAILYCTFSLPFWSVGRCWLAWSGGGQCDGSWGCCIGNHAGANTTRYAMISGGAWASVFFILFVEVCLNKLFQIARRDVFLWAFLSEERGRLFFSIFVCSVVLKCIIWYPILESVLLIGKSLYCLGFKDYYKLFWKILWNRSCTTFFFYFRPKTFFVCCSHKIQYRFKGTGTLFALPLSK